MLKVSEARQEFGPAKRWYVVLSDKEAVTIDQSLNSCLICIYDVSAEACMKTANTILVALSSSSLDQIAGKNRLACAYMTQSQLVALNKAYHLSIRERTLLSGAFHYLEHPEHTAFELAYEEASRIWDFAGETATRKPDGFCLSRDEIDSSEVLT